MAREPEREPGVTVFPAGRTIVDRDGIRADANATIETLPSATAVARAYDCLALLAELEQAERERDAMKLLADHHLVKRQNADHLREQAEARRARVPALVEAVSACVKTWHAHGYRHNHIPDALALSEALAEWEQA